MHPVLIDFGRFKLYSYGLMMFIAFAMGIWVAIRRGSKAGLPEGFIVDVSSAIIISGLIGARTMYVLTHPEEFRGHWLDVINPIQSDGTIGIAGLVLLGGVLAAVAVVVFMAWLKDINILKLTDVLAPSLMLGVGFGRIGCLLNGCCFGLPTQLPWGIVFSDHCPASSVYPGAHLHPTQIYESIYTFGIFLLLVLMERRFKYGNGFTFGLMISIYGIFRAINESLRYQESGLHFVNWSNGFITYSQGISVLMLVIGAFFIIKSLHSRSREPGSIA